jgi:hypothetical protein
MVVAVSFADLVNEYVFNPSVILVPDPEVLTGLILGTVSILYCFEGLRPTTFTVKCLSDPEICVTVIPLKSAQKDVIIPNHK